MENTVHKPYKIDDMKKGKKIYLSKGDKHMIGTQVCGPRALRWNCGLKCQMSKFWHPPPVGPCH